MIQDAREILTRCWFEYHCNESHDSSDAPAWYHSHQEVTVLYPVNADDVPATRAERIEDGNPLVYHVLFDDGLTWHVFEDELLDSPAEFKRPAPPNGKPCYA